MKAILLSKSSHGEPYKAEFTAVDDELRIFCHCQAGVLHRMCKHKQAFINGETEMLFDPNQTALLLEIHSWPQFKSLQIHLEACSKQLAEIEKAQRELDKKKRNKSKPNSAKD
jgi:hypothetical protein